MLLHISSTLRYVVTMYLFYSRTNVKIKEHCTLEFKYYVHSVELYNIFFLQGHQGDQPKFSSIQNSNHILVLEHRFLEYTTV